MMLCVTALVSGDVTHLRKIKIVITLSDAETLAVMTYIFKIEGLVE